MHLALGCLLLAVGAVLQAAVLGRLVDAPRPDVVLLIVLAWSMLRGFAEGTVCGVFGGLMLDLPSGAPFGLYTVLLGLIGTFTALGESNLYRGNVPLFLITAAVATVALHGGSLLGMQLAGQQTAGLVRFVQFVVPSALINALLMPITFTLVQRGVRALGGWRQFEL